MGTHLLEAPTVEGIQALVRTARMMTISLTYLFSRQGLVAAYKRQCKGTHAEDFVNIEWAILGLVISIDRLTVTDQTSRLVSKIACTVNPCATRYHVWLTDFALP
jgi:hypothetical protein